MNLCNTTKEVQFIFVNCTPLNSKIKLNSKEWIKMIVDTTYYLIFTALKTLFATGNEVEHSLKV